MTLPHGGAAGIVWLLVGLVLGAAAAGQEPSRDAAPLSLRLDAELAIATPADVEPAAADSPAAAEPVAVLPRPAPDVPRPGAPAPADATARSEAPSPTPPLEQRSGVLASLGLGAFRGEVVAGVAVLVLLACAVFLALQVRSLRAALRGREAGAAAEPAGRVRRVRRRAAAGGAIAGAGAPAARSRPMATVRPPDAAESEDDAVDRGWREVDTLLAFDNHERAVEVLRDLHARFPANADLIRRLAHMEAARAAAAASEGSRMDLNLASVDEPSTFEDAPR